MGEFFPRWKSLIRSRLAASSYYRYRTIAENILEPHFGNMRLSSIEEAEIEEFLALRSEKGLSAATLNYYIAILSSIFKHAMKSRCAARNPIRGVERAKVRLPPIVYISREDEARLLAALPGWVRPTAIVALDAGLRAGEIGALTLRDVDLGRAVITVRDSKNRESREIGMTRRLQETMRLHLKSLPSGQDRVFLRPDGRLFERHSGDDL